MLICTATFLITYINILEKTSEELVITLRASIDNIIGIVTQNYFQIL